MFSVDGGMHDYSELGVKVFARKTQPQNLKEKTGNQEKEKFTIKTYKSREIFRERKQTVKTVYIQEQ